MFDQADVDRLRATVRGLQTGSGDSRAVAIVDRLLDAVFPVLAESRVTPQEWDGLLTFLGQTDPVMMRAIAWCVGLSQIVEETASRIGPRATPACIEGPFHRPGAPEITPGMALHQVDDGAELLFLSGTVRDLDGRPIAEAELDVWAADGKGDYSFFDPRQPEHNCRGRLRSDAEGRWQVFSSLPAPYHMNVAQMGTVLRLMGHQIWRPAHVHFIITAAGFETLTTQLYFAGDPHLHDDPAIGVKPGLIIPLSRHDRPDDMRHRGVDRPFHTGQFDFNLQPV